MISLSKGHIIIDHTVVESIFEKAVQVNWVYYAHLKTLQIVSSEDTLFKTLHKTSMSMLKYKNDQGNRSLSVQELLIDQDLDHTDRGLDYFADDKMKILSIYFKEN